MEDTIILEIFSKRFAKLVEENHTDILFLLKQTGIKSKSTFYRYMNAQMAPKVTTVKILADIYNVNPLWLMGYDVPMENTTLKPNTIEISNNLCMIPVYGQIAAGQPNWAVECLEGYLPIDPNLMNIANPSETFFLRVNGESMNNIIRNGAYALIRKQDTVENGDIAVVLVDSINATLKKFTQSEQIVILSPDSSLDEFEPIVVDLKTTPIKILGKYIGKFEINN